ncbi:MAG: glutaredoxin domain-containing protein [SAR202 cluster bacterium]|jgi:glutaredoxin 3|nr:glutaredoxin domain-containing protein [SAR202 cluster bacterium]|tara:strand:+ start:213 stop:470 length:258 start_codon:yes stop_codon:yes gene_type:complete
MTKNIIEIYTTSDCYFCKQAKNILNKYSLEFIEYSVESKIKRQIMKKRAKGNYTVPQIFINKKLIGGFDELNLLEKQGKLQSLLS